MRILIFLLFFAFCSLFLQCTKDKAAPIIPPPFNICDSINPVSYSDDVVPILNDNGCFGCHSSFALPFFDDYSSVYTYRDSILLTIQHDPSLSPMPQGMPQMDDSLIAKVQCWIASGAPNN